MRYFIACLWVFFSVFAADAQQTAWPESLMITPEKSNFEKTSGYADLMQFLGTIGPMSRNMYVGSIGKSTGGKDIPMVVLSRPLVKTPAEARASGKPVVYIQGNIHGGEVEGKEVTMMLIRDILLGKRGYLLDNQVILFVPIYNTDGNDKMGKNTRPTQEGSPAEAGERENGQGLDLNRDGIKMEAPETEGLIRNLITAWDPQVSMDLHTTNGTWHGYSLTWAPSYLYAGEPATYRYTNDVLLPSVTKIAKEKYGLFMGPFGDFNTREGWPLKNFYTYNHHPRYFINQYGLRNRMAILSEAFAHERFYQRINSTYAFTLEVLEHCNKHAREIVQINRDAEQAAIRNILTHAGRVKKGVRFKMVPAAKKLNRFRTYDYTPFTRFNGSTGYVKTGRIVTYDSVAYYGEFKDTVQATLPRGYIIPASMANIAEHLRKQGATVTELTADESYTGEVFLVEKFSKAPRKFEGHNMASAEGKFVPAKRLFRKGDFKIDLAQPLANLIFYTLEPQSDDGLLVWNFFDSYLEQNGVAGKPVEFPVFKYFPARRKTID
ncbi:M14 family metallopeptidase [Sediminibacterium soli]|uniref:M14 family metallopeptidase n=1 Tax=Sediminibacterium soli TaxID=2698829 RepID=UPI00137B005A|nr:M14 family metallopeptidase [Sediminibacterium soli]NCI48115.1 M14 family metallopeptidase [Sediminibacterium soli]